MYLRAAIRQASPTNGRGERRRIAAQLTRRSLRDSLVFEFQATSTASLSILVIGK
jgi:hypothetical protein